MIGFLGFGYHEPLMDRLGITKVLPSAMRKAYGSAYELANGRRVQLIATLGMDLGPDHLKISKFLDVSSLLYQV